MVFGPKLTIFPKVFFLGTIGQENVFYDTLKRKSLKSRKIVIFPKGISHGFWSNNGHFSNIFFLANIGQENVFHDILQWKSGFLGYKSKTFKTSKNWHFSKGVNPWFWSKNSHFSNFFFRHYTPLKCLFDILERKNTFLGYKN